MLSNSCKYALKAVLYLAVHSRLDHKILAKDISKPINVPQAYTAKLLQELSRRTIVSSAKGPHGGFYLTEENKDNTLLAVVEVIDGAKHLDSCMLSLNACNQDHLCPIHELAGSFKRDFIKRLEATTIRDLVADIAVQKTFLPL